MVDARLAEMTAGLAEPLRGPVAALVGRPGKRLRSRLVLACARLGPADPERVAVAGAVVELLHLASLLHDDIVDGAEVRRGAPAAHTVVGSELASLAGLAAVALAGMAASDLGEGASQVVAQVAAGLAHGEILDVERAFDTGLPMADYLEMVERKTGDLFGLCCLLGAAEAGVPPPLVQALRRFGVQFGVAFQILDDCLDFDGDLADKSAGTDHRLGLFGAPTLLALAADDDGSLARLLLDPGLTAGALPQVQRRVVASGGVAAARELAADHFALARAALAEVPDAAVRDELAAFLTLER